MLNLQTFKIEWIWCVESNSDDKYDENNTCLSKVTDLKENVSVYKKLKNYVNRTNVSAMYIHTLNSIIWCQYGHNRAQMFTNFKNLEKY